MHQQTELGWNQACIRATAIPVNVNQSYGTTAPLVDSDPLYATVEGEHQQQGLELTENQAYTATPNIPVEPNQCYGTTTPSVNPDQLNATVERDQGASNHLQAEDYDYI